jgi:phage major head subunit gpT-like protein
MALNTAKYISVQRDLTQKFREGAQNATPFYPTLCTEIQSNGPDEKYGILGSMPGVKEWLGDRQFKKLRAGDFTIANREWENSVEFEKNDIDDDRIGLMTELASDFGAEAVQHPDELLIEALVAGESTACFDGQFFFDTDHSWGDSGTQSNDLSYAAASGTTPTADEFKAAFHQSRVAMLGFKNDQGKKLNRPVIRGANKLLCLVPLELQEVATAALNAQLTSQGGTNTVLDQPEIVACPALTDATKFYTFNMEGVLKPFVFQKRRPIRTPVWKGMDDPETKVLKMMTDARYNLGYLAWWKATVTVFT